MLLDRCRPRSLADLRQWNTNSYLKLNDKPRTRNLYRLRELELVKACEHQNHPSA
ncbi:protein of unknown function [Sterolibacterium denitrificans]|uniref:Uncharacterized protein n=1 Tax=Sterolibacterium denitrificans TaxID=157592 RepID=A0A7Z7MVE3_9PROT|nr:hypothetical protein [Sterolibacterium denitrificans]SMB25200.1 protein of unknown function [Sterolibacterium denitrificans]